jgi:HAD superfamily hydrolase (TIGR01459 family)|tara:strand:+ start:227 stop:1108 length:882 start_codon:yes stop_codon:yes gene_type:complete
MVKVIKHLKQISSEYNVVFCDIWGCIHNGKKAYTKALNALIEFKMDGGFVMLLTNAPRPKSAVKAHLSSLGIFDEHYNDITTSGDAAQNSMLSGDVGTRVFHLGPERDLSFFTDLPRDIKFKNNIERVGLTSAEGIVCTGLFNDLTETPENYKDIIKHGVNKKLNLLCVNPDIFVDVGAIRVWCAGGIAAAFTKAGGNSIYCGKPHKQIYSLAYSKLKKHNIKTPKILCIGDGINTDILGGKKEKLDTLFVCGGLSGPELGMKNNFELPNKKRLEELFKKNNILPTVSIGYLN